MTIRVLLVAPGPKHSTFDIFSYYLDAMKDNDEVIVEPFNFHNIMAWQKSALEFYDNEMPEYKVNVIANSRAARDLLAEVVLFQPDIVFVVSGTLLPEFIWKHLVNLRNKLTTKFAIGLYLTESPYLDDLQENYRQYADFTFSNDLYTVNKWNPEGLLHIHYLPHSFNPKIHRPMDGLDEDKYGSDVFFLGTPFFERGELLAKVDWGDIDFKLGGNWAEFCKPTDYLKLAKYNFFTDAMYNEEVLKYYASTKIGLNIHRTSPDIDGMHDQIDNFNEAYSIGPRIYEIAASETLIMTDFRREAIDIFDDSIVLFNNANELEREVKFWTSDKADSLREEKILRAKEQVKDCSFAYRLDNILLPVFDEVLALR